MVALNLLYCTGDSKRKFENFIVLSICRSPSEFAIVENSSN